MKKIYLYFTTSILITLLCAFSCNDSEGYSLGEFRVNIATIHTLGENNGYYVQLDNGKKLFPAASEIRFTPKNDQRVFINYTILSDKQNDYNHYIKVNDMWNILTKETIDLTAQNADSIGNDPIKINDIWIGGDFLNIDFSFNYGGVRPHAINLVNDLLSTETNPQGAIDLSFRHNAYNSRNDELYEGFVCFNLKQYQSADADEVRFVINVKDFEGDKKYELVYRYNEIGLVNASEASPIPVISSNEYY